MEAKRKGKLSVSVSTIDLLHAKAWLDFLEKEKVEYLHVDVMDGEFIPSYANGVQYIQELRQATSIPLDIHLMINNPENKLDWFDIQPKESVSIHFESTPHVQRALEKIREKGARSMLTLNPATPLYVLEDVLDDLDAVSIMTGNPSILGQTFVPHTLKKIERLRKWLDESGHHFIDVEVDGNVTFELAPKMRAAGGDIFVIGKPYLLHNIEEKEEVLEKIRQFIE